MSVADRGIEHDAAQLAEELDHLVGGPCGGGADLVQFAPGVLVGFGQAAVELVDRLVGDVDQRLPQESDQQRIAPLLGHPLEGLAGGPAGGLGQPLEAVGAEAAEVPSGDVGGLQELELLEGLQDRLRRVGDGRAAEPGERRPATRVVEDEQAVEQRPSRVAEQGFDEAEGLALRPLLGGDDDPFESGQAGPHDLVGAESLAGELEEQGRAIVLQGPLDEPDLEGLQVGGLGLAEAEVGQDILEVGGPGLGSLPVPAKATRIDVELAGEMLDGGRGRGVEPGRHEAQVAEGTELHGDPEPVVVTPLLLHQPSVAVGEGEVGDQVLGRDFLSERSARSHTLHIGQEEDCRASVSLASAAR